MTGLNSCLERLLPGETLQPKERTLRVNALANDSREVRPGTLFLAMPGANGDGRDFLSEAAHSGASAILVESSNADRWPAIRQGVVQNVPIIAIEDLAQKTGFIAARFYQHPSQALKVTGITGTNGKTSCAFMLAQAYEKLGVRCSLIGTLGVGFLDQLQASNNTTPGALGVQRALFEAKKNGAKAVAMEVSSHGLDQHRVNGVDFETVVFTNLSHDHLDYHQSMEAYAAAKRKLFEWPGIKHAVINVSDKVGAQFETCLAASVKSFSYAFAPDASEVNEKSIDEKRVDEKGIDDESVDEANLSGAERLSSAGGIPADLLIEMSHCDSAGAGLTLQCVFKDQWVDGPAECNQAAKVTQSATRRRLTITSPLWGGFNAGNLVAVLQVLRAQGVEMVCAAKVIGEVVAPPGRMQLLPPASSRLLVDSGNDQENDNVGDSAPLVLIDYAHTPDALAKCLESIRQHGRSRLAQGGRLIVVFGCGGDRDRDKRAPMGAVASTLADSVWITNDNSRGEKPEQIAADIIAGIDGVQRQRIELTIELDRHAAITRAITLATSNDIVCIAGKGHETTQHIGQDRFVFSDTETAIAAQQARNCQQEKC